MFLIAASVLGIASIGFWKIKEIRTSILKIDKWSHFIHRIKWDIRKNEKLKHYIFLKNIHFIRQRIDQPFDLSDRIDKIWISFVIHGFPNKVRHTILENVFRHLKSGGYFFILDFSEFKLDEMPALYRFIFQSIECKYAFDFIRRHWKQILSDYHFTKFKETFFFRHYVRLLEAKKNKMKTIKIAVPTNDERTVFPKMLGMAEKLFIYETADGKAFKLIEKRTNPYARTQQHLKTLDVYDLISDCSVIISGHIGKKGITRLQERGMALFFAKGNIQDALTDTIKKKQT